MSNTIDSLLHEDRHFSPSAEFSANAIAQPEIYDRARAAHAIVVTGETQPFANFILRKGAIGDNLRP